MKPVIAQRFWTVVLRLCRPPPETASVAARPPLDAGRGASDSAGRRRRRAFRHRISIAFALAVLIGTVWHWIPEPSEWLAPRPATTVLIDRTGRPLRIVLAEDGQDCRWVPYDEMGPWIGPALIAAEDGRFFSHPGVDLLAIGRAVIQNLARGRVVSGASTISTQVVRLAQPRPRTYATKLIEALMALKMERRLSKERILEEYLNRAPFGGFFVGVQAAARRYFGKDARELSLGEAALLAGLPQSPARYRPDRHLDRALWRRDYVLDRMARRGWITEAQRTAALAQPLVIEQRNYPLRAPHFAERARALTPPNGIGHTVRTSLDPTLQRLAEDALRRRVAALRDDGVRGGAVVVIEVATGAVRAMVGSPDPDDRTAAGQVNAALAPRSAGSTLKPLLYAIAFDEGRLTPLTVLPDVPRQYPDYSPANFDGEFRGLVTARAALLDSLNIPALDLAREFGLERFHQRLRAFGLTTLTRPSASYGLGLALGNGEVTLLELANAYAALARGGEARPVGWFEDEPPARAAQVVSAEAAWLVSDILSDPERSAPAAVPAASARLPSVAWKTGTSSGFRDAWTIAWNPEYVIGVWLGNPDGAASPALVGGSAAAPAAWDLFRALYPHGDAPEFVRPPGIRAGEVCAISGRPPGPHCPTTTRDFLITGVTRHRGCEVHVCRSLAEGPSVAEVWPEDVAAFLQHSRRAIPSAVGAGEPNAPPIIVSPKPGSPYRRWSPDGSHEHRLPLIAQARGQERLWWFADGAQIGSARPGEPVWWPPTPGRHRIVCSDAAGRRTAVEIVIE